MVKVLETEYLTDFLIKFRYCEKATKLEKSSLLLKLFSNVKTKWEIFSNFCGHLRMSELFHKECLKEQLEIWSEIK